MSEEHEHRHVPAIHVVNGEAVWERRLAHPPLYPFFCLECQEILWLGVETAAARGLVFNIFRDTEPVPRG